MNKARCVCLPLLLFVLAGAIQAAPVKVRNALSHTEAWQGEGVILTIDVLAEEAWAKLSPLKLPQVEGTQVVRVETQGMRLNERIDNVNYTGTRYEILLFAQKTGEIQIPSQELSVYVQRWGKDEAQYSIVTEALTYRVKRPPGMGESSQWVVTELIELEQKWIYEKNEEEKNEFYIGDAIQRKIQIKAEGVAAMTVPPVVFLPVAGVDSYPASPRLENQVNRGGLRAERRESITYIMQRDGTIELPSLEILSWNPKTLQPDSNRLPGKKINVLRKNISVHNNYKVIFGAVAVISVLTGWLLWKRKYIVLVFGEMVSQNQRREYYLWWQLKKRIKQGDNLSGHQYLIAWLGAIQGGRGQPRFDLFLQSIRMEEIYPLYTQWILAEPPLARVQRVEFLQNIKTARAQFFKHRQRRERIESVLPSLN